MDIEAANYNEVVEWKPTAGFLLYRPVHRTLSIATWLSYIISTFMLPLLAYLWLLLDRSSSQITLDYLSNLLDLITASNSKQSTKADLYTYIFLAISLAIALLHVIFLLIVLSLKREFQFRYRLISSVFRSLTEILQVLAVIGVVRTQRDLSGIKCWFYVTLAAYFTLVTRVISPSFKLLLPALFCEIAITESLEERFKGAKPYFRVLICVVCACIFQLKNAFGEEFWKWGWRGGDKWLELQQNARDRRGQQVAPIS